MTSRIEKLLGKAGIYIARKFFGIILLAVSVGMCVSNVAILVSNLDEKGEDEKLEPAVENTVVAKPTEEDIESVTDSLTLNGTISVDVVD